MRLYPIIAIAFAAVFTACSSSFELDHPLTPRPDDWLQLGGDAGRTNSTNAAMGARVISSQAMNADSSAVVWEYGLDGPAGTAAPLLVQGTVLFFSNTGWGEAVNLESGERVGEIPCKWFIHATPAVAAGCLFVATNGLDPLLLCFDLKERIIRYEAHIPSVHASVCAVGERVIVAARNGEVRSYGAADSLPSWRLPLHDMIIAAPAANDSVVVIAGQNGDLNGIAVGDGRKLWRLSTGSAFLAGPSARNQSVVAVNIAGLVTMADIATGSIRWQVNFGQAVYQGIAWRGDTLAFALSGGDIVLLHTDDGREIARVATDELPGAAPLFHGSSILLLQRRGVLVDIDPATGIVTELARLDTRSEMAPLLTPRGVVIVDEEGEGVLVRME